MPLSITMDTTHRCNSRCKTCYFSLPSFKPKGRDMTFDEFKCVAGKLQNYSGRLALSCEFEPLLHPDIEQIILASKVLAKTWKIRVNTNGIMLSEAISKALIESGVAEIYVSIDAPSNEMNSKIRGSKTLPRIIKELKKMAALKKDAGCAAPVCILRSTAMRANLHQLPDMVNLSADVGAERYCIKHLLPITECEWDGRPIAEQSCLLIPGETKAVFDSIRDQGKSLGVAVDLPPAAPRDSSELRIACGYVSNGFHIFPDGVCYPCVWLTSGEKYGNIFHDSIDEILNSMARKDFARSFQPPNTPIQCLNCLRDSQTIGLKAENNARARLEQH